MTETDLDAILAKYRGDFCLGCGNEIDPTTCWCGAEYGSCRPDADGHSSVPIGCDCMRERE